MLWIFNAQFYNLDFTLHPFLLYPLLWFNFENIVVNLLLEYLLFYKCWMNAVSKLFLFPPFLSAKRIALYNEFMFLFSIYYIFNDRVPRNRCIFTNNKFCTAFGESLFFSIYLSLGSTSWITFNSAPIGSWVMFFYVTEIVNYLLSNNHTLKNIKTNQIALINNNNFIDDFFTAIID